MVDTAYRPPPTTQAPSLADQWRRHLQEQAIDPTRPVLVDLPSGMRVRATRTNILLLMRYGRIPDALAPRVEELIGLAQGGGDEAVRVSLTHGFASNPAALQVQLTTLFDAVWLATVVEPVFTDDPDTNPDAISVDAVSDADKSFLFSWCQGVTETAAQFLDRTRGGAAALVGTPPVGDGLRAGPAGAPGDRPEA
jgi:hypothetical protein